MFEHWDQFCKEVLTMKAEHDKKVQQASSLDLTDQEIEEALKGLQEAGEALEITDQEFNNALVELQELERDLQADDLTI